MTQELEQLLARLDGLRAGVLEKLAGLSEEVARRSTLGSGTNIAGLVQHLTFVELFNVLFQTARANLSA